MKRRRVCIALEGGELSLRPAMPWQWRAAAREHPGPAGQCLELLATAGARWRGPGADAAIDPDAAAPRPLASRDLAAIPAAAADSILDALCAPWPRPGDQRDLEDLARHLRARRDFPAMSCPACREQEDRGEGAPDCAACPIPPPPGGAEAALCLEPVLSALPPAAQGLGRDLLAGLLPHEKRLLALQMAMVRSLLPSGPSPRPLATQGEKSPGI